MNYIIIKGKKFPVLLAISSEEQMQGLMYRDPPLPAMVFLSRRPENRSFWMKNVKADLDIVFCLNNKVSSIWKGESNSTRIVGGGEISDLVIEFPYGFCKAEGISAGSEISVELSKAAAIKVLMLKTGLIY